MLRPSRVSASFLVAFFLAGVGNALPDERSAVDRIDILRRANRSTVRVEAVQRARRTPEISGGAGVVVSEGCILTAHHVVRGHSDICVLTASGMCMDAKVVWIERDLDLALLRVSQPTDLEAASIAPAQSIREGKAAVVIGNPLGRGQKVVTGRLGPERLVHWDGKSAQLRAVVANVEPGNSGGGAYDLSTGELLGITVAKSSTLANTGYVVPADRIADRLKKELALRELSDAGEVQTAIGVALRPVNLTQGRFTTGMLVTYLETGSLAEAAGWKQGDVLLGLDKYRTTSLKDVIYVLRQPAGDDSSTITCLLAGAGGSRHVSLQMDRRKAHPTGLAFAQASR